MVLLDYNSSGDVVVYADVLLFRSYISTVLDYAYGVFKRATLTRNLTECRNLRGAHWSQ